MQRGHSSVIDCTVRNISDTGALIAVENAAVAPERFELEIDGNTRRCIVVWRKLGSLGVRFE